MKRLACTYRPGDGRAYFYSHNVAEYQGGGLRMALYGRLISEGVENDFSAIRQALMEDPALKRQRWGGTYLLMVYDENDKTLRVFQDFLNGPLAVYYAQAKDKVYIDTSLKHLLARSGLRPAINRAAAAQFMRHGAVMGQDTLLEGVYKLAPLRALAVKEAPRQYPVSYCVEPVGLEQAKSRWEEVLTDSICACARGRGEVSMPLSSGYDSNYILYALHRHTPLPINLYSLGARRGVSELDVVKGNAACYPRAHLKTGYTGPETLTHFEDMVWRLEGAVFEAGIFLQYELARLMGGDHRACAVCGECADQLMHQDFSLENRAQFPDPRCACIAQDPYAYGAAIVVKKSGIMLNSFDVEGRYPYVDLRLAALCKALRPVNKKGKLYHKSVCRARLPARVLRYIAKVGGSTSLHSLFDGQAQIDAFLAGVERSRAYARYASLIPAPQKAQGGVLGKVRRFVDSEPSFRHLLGKVLGKLRVTPADCYRADFRRQERKLNDYMRLCYLGAFETLFVDAFEPQMIDRALPARPILAAIGADGQAARKNMAGKTCVA